MRLSTVLTGHHAIEEAVIVEHTGRSSEAWYGILDHWCASGQSADASADYLQTTYELSGWWASTIITRYQLVRGLERDVIQIPDDLRAALTDQGLLAMFSALPDMQQREFIEWIEGAQTKASRQRRVEKIIARIREF